MALGSAKKARVYEIRCHPGTRGKALRFSRMGGGIGLRYPSRIPKDCMLGHRLKRLHGVKD